VTTLAAAVVVLIATNAIFVALYLHKERAPGEGSKQVRPSPAAKVKTPEKEKPPGEVGPDEKGKPSKQVTFPGEAGLDEKGKTSEQGKPPGEAGLAEKEKTPEKQTTQVEPGPDEKLPELAADWVSREVYAEAKTCEGRKEQGRLVFEVGQGNAYARFPVEADSIRAAFASGPADQARASIEIFSTENASGLKLAQCTLRDDGRKRTLVAEINPQAPAAACDYVVVEIIDDENRCVWRCPLGRPAVQEGALTLEVTAEGKVLSQKWTLKYPWWSALRVAAEADDGVTATFAGEPPGSVTMTIKSGKKLSRDLAAIAGPVIGPRTRVNRAESELKAARSEEIAPAENWLAELAALRREDTEFDAACAALELALEKKKDRLVVEELAASVSRFGRGMPEPLAAGLKTRLDELRRRARGRRWLAAIGITGGLLLLAAGLAALLVWHASRSELARWEGSIAACLEAGDLEQVHALFKQLESDSPGLFAAPEVQRLQDEYRRHVDDENHRRQQFASIKSAIEAGASDVQHLEDLSKAEDIARTPEEKQWAQNWREKLQRSAGERRRAREIELERRTKELEDLGASLVQAAKGDADALETQADKTKKQADGLLVEPDLPETLRARVTAAQKAMTQEVARAREAAEKTRSAAERLARLPQLVDKPEALVDSLEAFVQSFHDHRLAADFGRALTMKSHWGAAEAWLNIFGEWGGRLRLNGAGDVPARQKRTDEYLKTYPNGPFEAAVREYQAYLRCAKEAFADGQLAGYDNVRANMNHAVFAPDLQIVRTTDSLTYYCLPAKIREARINNQVVGYRCDYYISMQLNAKTVLLSKDAIALGPQQAPQISLAKAVMAELNRSQSDKREWETFYLRLAALIGKQQDVDPVLTVQLLILMLKSAEATTPFEASKVKQRLAPLSAKKTL
jgi:hypothetical protein